MEKFQHHEFNSHDCSGILFGVRRRSEAEPSERKKDTAESVKQLLKLKLK